MFKNTDLFPSKPECSLSAYIHEEDSSLRPAVIVCPGGGYNNLSAREADPVAMHYYNAGLNAFVLRYSVAKKAINYAPLIEAAMAIKQVRQNAAEYNVDPKKIIICGFSAGGHLAGSAGILWNIPEVRDAIGVTDGSAPEGINRPDGMILSYPVITADEYTHKGSIKNLSGKDEYDESDIEKFSLERHVDSTTPPMFIWHTANDSIVNIKNSLMLIDACVENATPFEAHIYPSGPHGMSLCNKLTWDDNPKNISEHVGTWKDLSLMWIDETFNK